MIIREILDRDDVLSPGEGDEVARAVVGGQHAELDAWLQDILLCDARTSVEAKLAAIVRGLLMVVERSP